MATEESINVTHQIVDSEEHLYRKQYFQSSLDRIADVDEQVYKLIKKFGSEGGSKGKLIESMEEKADQQFIRNKAVLEEADDTIDQAIKSFDEQVDAMKTQNMTIYYKDRGGSAF
ncbi:hypothetical protein P6709_15380 [Jeotgalibacillus sp. ET6]|uniref:hypothetical protein n=1 Tax=Jeotgalibacillus sp. ET6 TaxID=3037260 RepID=UPI0024186ACE|nr:hypothetical protein [Jeotgalibacillus sp. ET6]MDG5473134.1 hypothetical protein [Jeotgalibacillus sp. ET6]